ncbi:unnamed protein product [Acanthoscelides obtectus]|uniref:Uncharacterized protein n=1 Tax=Acanthoscelides obtectus TaxID=200917 RepID=A0A9P0PQN4_ACAOB|nr:unnamed protein product [Acanthoscelides obtectus]CAK1656853.1 hypothetical protein AOBTE_LOCUS19964 [Acanthoscelides obtectus]
MAEISKVAQNQIALTTEIAGVRAAQEQFTSDLQSIKVSIKVQEENILPNMKRCLKILNQSLYPAQIHITVLNDMLLRCHKIF